MASLWRFVDSIASSPTVRLDLNAGSLWVGSGFDLSPPPVRRAYASSMLSDGDALSAWSYANRTLTIPIQLLTDDADAAALALQRLGRELARDSNFLLVQLGTVPYFFRTLPAPDYAFKVLKTLVQYGRATLEIPAEPFAYGLKETVSQVTVNNDPAAGSNGLFFDVTAVKGDVETPLMMRITATGKFDSGVLSSVLATRRRGTPSSMPLVLQCESMTLGTDTTLPGNDAVMSGASSNYARCSFATNPTVLASRVRTSLFPAAASVDARGVYRVFARNRQSVAGDVMELVLRFGSSDSASFNFVNAAVQVTGTNRRWTDLGLLSMPLGNDPVGDGPSGSAIAVRGIAVEVAARRVSGSGNLDFDVLLFVPADDQLAFIRWPTADAAVDNYTVDAGAGIIYPLEGTTEIRSVASGVAFLGQLPLVSPGVTNRVVWMLNAGPANQADDIADTTVIDPYYWPRYLFMRPVST